MALALVGNVIHPHGGNAQVLHRQQAIRAHDALEVLCEPQQARVGLAQIIEIARVEIVIVAVKVEPHAVIQQRPPGGELKLPFHHARQAVVSRPGIQEEAFLRQPLAVSGEKARGQPGFAEVQMDGVELMAARRRCIAAARARRRP